MKGHCQTVTLVCKRLGAKINEIEVHMAASKLSYTMAQAVQLDMHRQIFSSLLCLCSSNPG